MDKNNISNFFKDFFNKRNVTFYVALGAAGLAFIGGIVASAGLRVADCGPLPAVLTLIGLIALFGFSLVDHEWVGAGAAAATSFCSIVAMICNVYSYYLSEIQNLAMTGISAETVMAVPGIGALIASLIILLICSVAAFVCMWLRLRKRTPEELEARNAKKAAMVAAQSGETDEIGSEEK